MPIDSLQSKSTIAIAILVAVVAAASSRIYAVSESSGGYLMWNSAEAYLFMEVDDSGYNASYLSYPWILFKEYIIGGFAAAVFPSDRRASLVVMRVTSDGVERHTLKLDRTELASVGSDPERFTPLNGEIYAICPALCGQCLCRWAGDHFVEAAQEEQRRLDGLNRLTKADLENDSNGWSRREFGAALAGRKFTIDVGDSFRLLINNVARGTENSALSIDLLRPGKAAERIGDFYARQGSVSDTEYQHVFENRQ